MFLPKAQASIKDSKEQFENFLKHTEKGIEFSEKYSNFVKQRAEYEVEHAKNLRKLVKAFQPKKKGDADSELTYFSAFSTLLSEVAHEAELYEKVAEKLNDNVAKDIQALVIDLRQKKRKLVAEAEVYEKQLQASLSDLDRTKRQYEKTYKQSVVAAENWQKADADLNLSRAELERTKNIMITKSQSSEEFKSEYAKQLETTNADQRAHYHVHAPALFQTLRVIDKTRVTRFADSICVETHARIESVPALQQAQERVLEAAGSVDPTPDWQIVIQRSKNGFLPPLEIPFEDAGSNAGSSAAMTAAASASATLPNGVVVDCINGNASAASAPPIVRSSSSSSSGSGKGAVGSQIVDGRGGGGGVGGVVMNSVSDSMRRSTIGTLDNSTPLPQKPEKNKGRRNTLMKIFKSSGRSSSSDVSSSLSTTGSEERSRGSRSDASGASAGANNDAINDVINDINYNNDVTDSGHGDDDSFQEDDDDTDDEYEHVGASTETIEEKFVPRRPAPRPPPSHSNVESSEIPILPIIPPHSHHHHQRTATNSPSAAPQTTISSSSPSTATASNNLPLHRPVCVGGNAVGKIDSEVARSNPTNGNAFFTSSPSFSSSSSSGSDRIGVVGMSTPMAKDVQQQQNQQPPECMDPASRPLPVLCGCRALYSFNAINEETLDLREGEELFIVELDEGDGWTRVRRTAAGGGGGATMEEGYAPTSYLEMDV